MVRLMQFRDVKRVGSAERKSVCVRSTEEE
jgi:hypothetical protein